jgi:2-polyprenyl-3-methyl-5-hydroxy-6-metoxy-1,4-benzoquinol methylase
MSKQGSDIQKRVDEAAEFYDSRLDFDRYLIDFSWRRIKDRAQPGNCLELGSSEGLMTEQLAQHFESVTVVEGNQKNLDLIEGKFSNVSSHCSLFENFKTDKKFDNIVLARVLEHMADPIGLLKTTKSWLKPEGIVHIIVPNAKSVHRFLGVAMGMIHSENELTERDHNVGHLRVYDQALLGQHIGESGLNLIEMSGSFFKPLSNSQMLEFDEKILEGYFKLSDLFNEHCAEIYAVCRV